MQNKQDEKPVLKSKIVTLIEVKYRDLEEFIYKVYGTRLEIPDAEEWSNHSDQTMSIKKEAIGNYDQKRITHFLAGWQSSCGITRVLLQDMVNRDLIPAGDYLISVTW